MSETSVLSDPSPITQAEMVELFGSRMPIEAVNLLWDSDGSKTVGEVRAELRKIAASRHAASKRPGLTNELADELRGLANHLRDDDRPYSADVVERAARALSAEIPG